MMVPMNSTEHEISGDVAVCPTNSLISFSWMVSD